MQPMKYVYNAEVHRLSNVSSFDLVLSCQIPRPARFDDQTAFPIEDTSTASPYALKPGLLYRVVIMPQEVGKKMKLLQQKYKDDWDGKI